MNQSLARNHHPDPDQTSAKPAESKAGEKALRIVKWFAEFYGLPYTASAVLSRLPSGAKLSQSADLELALETLGLRCRPLRTALKRLDPVVLPCVVFDRRNRALVVCGIGPKRKTVSVYDPETNRTEEHPMSVFNRRVNRDLLLVTLVEDDRSASRQERTARRLDAKGHWFWAPVAANWRNWLQILLATMLINVMALALPLFVMNVYDRVIPTFSTITLWTLAIGVCIAIGLDLLLRMIRARLLETISRRVDLKVASALFRHAMDIRLLDRASGASGLASRIREYEAVRELFASASFVAFVDLLFVGIFVAVLYLIVGPLAYIPLVAIFVVLLVAVLAQIPMARTAGLAVNVAARRLNVLTETLLGIETIKTLNAEPVVQREWEHAVAASARVNSRSRVWSNFTQSMTLLVQQLVSVGIILWGVYLVVDGQISVGALIAANILAGRALAPLSMIAQTIFRGQYARKSMAALDEVMALPTERPPSVRSHLRVRSGSIALKDVSFTYPEASRPALDSVSLEIAAGSRVALLGRVGSGKTTLGKLIAGLITPDHGTILVDRHGLAQYDPAELRDGIGYLPQTNQFFSGTLRENLLLGRPNAPQSDIEMALYVSGLDAVVSSNPQGLDIAIGDQGERLSGGQAQALSLARLLLRRPRLMFLDEPTNAMDQEMEGRVCSRLATEIGPEVGLVLCTHRQSLAAIADRYVVLDAGRVLLDGTREDVTARLMGQPSPETTGDL